MLDHLEPSALNSKQVLAYYRIYNKQECLVLHNITAGKLSLPITEKEKPFSSITYPIDRSITFEGDKINLPPYSTVVLFKPMSPTPPIK